jgi:hypothetical protein
MSTKLPASLFLAGLFALAVSASAQNDAPAAAPKPPTKAELKKYDANGDGQLDEAERAKQKADAAAKRAADKQERLDKYDANKDGKVSKAEREAEDADKASRKAEREAKKAAKESEKKASENKN